MVNPVRHHGSRKIADRFAILLPDPQTNTPKPLKWAPPFAGRKFGGGAIIRGGQILRPWVTWSGAASKEESWILVQAHKEISKSKY